MTNLRPYQQDMYDRIVSAWSSHRNSLAVLPTGGGKTVLFTGLMSRFRNPIAVAHRQELVSQMSLTLARQGVYHRLIAPTASIREIVKLHMMAVGKSFYHPNAPTACAGIDTLIKKQDPWFKQVDLWVMDEAHHVLQGNKWGTGAAMFPNARGLGVTATPVRADGKGLGRHADGLFDTMVEGPCGRDLITQGFLCDYNVAAPTVSINREQLPVGSTGDFNPHHLRIATKDSAIVGDVVSHYLRMAAGKLGVTFAVDVEDATQIAESFRKAGVPAEVVTAKTGTLQRAAILEMFRRREILQLVNVDLFGEGFDLPALEVVSMARPTESYALYAQQFGRVLRPAEGKDRGLILDHVGNVIRHGLPDGRKRWTLDARERRGSNHPSLGEAPLTTCQACGALYPRSEYKCVECGHVPVPASRSGPSQVEGDLVLLDENMLAQLRGEVERIDREAMIPHHLKGTPAEYAIKKRHAERQAAQSQLRESMHLWSGYRTREGMEVRVQQRLFYHVFGVDVMTAQTLGAADAAKLKNLIDGAVNREA